MAKLPGAKFCGDRCRWAAGTGGDYVRRARHYGVPYERFDVVEQVLERDGWKCRICGVDTPKELRGTYGPCEPTVDHIVPLSHRGGPGHVPDNCQCACRRCNGLKGASLPSDAAVPALALA